MTQQKNISDVHQKLYRLVNDIRDCARQIKIWLKISQAKSMQYEPFWWFIQHSCLKLIAIESYKILKETKSYIQSITDTIFTKVQFSAVIKSSELQQRLTILSKIVEPLKDYRNKMFAHIENYDLPNITCNLQDLFEALANIANSIAYIEYYIINPHWVSKEEWTNHFQTKNTANNLKDFEEYFKTELPIENCQKIINMCQQSSHFT